MNHSSKTYYYSVIQAIIAAGLFGASTPFAKALIGKMEPYPLAAFLYLGSGVGAALFMMLRSLRSQHNQEEPSLTKTDLPWLAGAIIAGGVAAPIVLMVSLKNTPAATASLLLNFEGVATVLIAAVLFRENVGRRIWAAVAFITISSILLSLNMAAQWGISVGSVGVLAACALWGVDNNLTRNVSGKDPLKIVAAKGLCAGSVSLLLSFMVGQGLPSVANALAAMLLGSICYGASIVLFILAMRGLGAARTSAYFGTAPFIGALISFVVFREHPGALFLISIPIMIIGAVLMLSEQHEHAHEHTVVEHEHRHSHDDAHHTHSHSDDWDGNGSHSHSHRHESTEHSHPHAPDIHHRHEHG